VVIKVESDSNQQRFEKIGNVEGGILAAQWTLDEEILAIASGIPPLPHHITNECRCIKTTIHDPRI